MTRILILNALAAFTVAAALASQRAFAELQGDRELLRQAAMEHRENRERIQTWQGLATIRRQRIESGQTVQLRSDVQFYWAGDDRFRWDWSAQRNQKSSMQLAGPNSTPLVSDIESPLFVTGIAADGRLYVHSNITAAGTSLIERRPRLRTTRLEEDLTSKEDSIGFLSPMWHIVHCGSSAGVERVLLHYFETADDPLNHAVVSLADDLLTVSVKHPRIDLFAEYQYDLAKQGNVVRMNNGDSNTNDSYSYTWEQVSGVWVPKTMHREFNRNQKTASPTTILEDVEWTQNLVNEPIDAGLFDVESIELLPDTRRINEITGQSDPNTPPPGTPVSTLETPAGSGSSNLRMLLITNILGALLILGIVTWRKFSHRQGRSPGSTSTTSASSRAD